MCVTVEQMDAINGVPRRMGKAAALAAWLLSVLACSGVTPPPFPEVEAGRLTTGIGETFWLCDDTEWYRHDNEAAQDGSTCQSMEFGSWHQTEEGVVLQKKYACDSMAVGEQHFNDHSDSCTELTCRLVAEEERVIEPLLDGSTSLSPPDNEQTSQCSNWPTDLQLLTADTKAILTPPWGSAPSYRLCGAGEYVHQPRRADDGSCCPALQYGQWEHTTEGIFAQPEIICDSSATGRSLGSDSQCAFSEACTEMRCWSAPSEAAENLWSLDIVERPFQFPELEVANEYRLSCERPPSLSLAATVPDLCEPSEDVTFSCGLTNGKVVSVCSHQFRQGTYRYGKPGAVELTFTGKRDDFHRTRQSNSSTHNSYIATLSFENEGFEYAIVERKTPDNFAKDLVVSKADSELARFECGPEVRGTIAVW
jgi:hypothetical protein